MFTTCIGFAYPSDTEPIYISKGLVASIEVSYIMHATLLNDTSSYLGVSPVVHATVNSSTKTRPQYTLLDRLKF